MKDIAMDGGAVAASNGVTKDHLIQMDAKASCRAVIAASAGNALEWYNFTVYALFAVYIGQNVFQNADQTVQLMASFLAFVVRPLDASCSG